LDVTDDDPAGIEPEDGATVEPVQRNSPVSVNELPEFTTESGGV
jgi:hypothetical protein